MRSKGFFTLASRIHVTGLWSQAGGAIQLDPAAAADPHDVDLTESGEDAPPLQELVFIGQGLDRDSLRRALDRCLLTDGELALGHRHWSRFADPLPAWDAYSLGEDCDCEA